MCNLQKTTLPSKSFAVVLSEFRLSCIVHDVEFKWNNICDNSSDLRAASAAIYFQYRFTVPKMRPFGLRDRANSGLKQFTSAEHRWRFGSTTTRSSKCRTPPRDRRTVTIPYRYHLPLLRRHDAHHLPFWLFVIPATWQQLLLCPDRQQWLPSGNIQSVTNVNIGLLLIERSCVHPVSTMSSSVLKNAGIAILFQVRLHLPPIDDCNIPLYCDFDVVIAIITALWSMYMRLSREYVNNPLIGWHWRLPHARKR